MDAVLNWLWQGGVVAVVSFVMLRALERARANVRYLVCWAALVAVMVLPVLPTVQLTVVSPDPLQTTPGNALVALPDTWWTSTLVLLAAWIAWASIHAIRFIAAIVAIRRARAHSVPFPATVSMKLSNWARVQSKGRRTTLVLSEAVNAAAVLGWGTPMIAVAPSLVETLDADELDRVLIHEWAHVQRRDDFVNIAQILVRAVVGWHPAVWWIDRRLQVEREIACDEVTVAITGSPKTYAECLMKLASLRTGSRTMHAAPAVLAASGLRARIVKIVSARPSITPLWSRGIAGGIVTVLCLTSMVLAGVKVVQATVLALPVPAAPQLALGTTPHRGAPIAVPIPSDIKTDRPLRTVSRLAATPDRQTPSVPLPPPTIESSEPLILEGGHGLDAPAATEANPKPVVTPVSADKPRAPWTAAADGGAAIGRKSKDAGVATAGFFTRVAHRVAGSF